MLQTAISSIHTVLHNYYVHSAAKYLSTFDSQLKGDGYEFSHPPQGRVSCSIPQS